MEEEAFEGVFPFASSNIFISKLLLNLPTQLLLWMVLYKPFYKGGSQLCYDHLFEPHFLNTLNKMYADTATF